MSNNIYTLLEQAQDCSIYIPTDEEASKYYIEIPYEEPSEDDHNGWGGEIGRQGALTRNSEIVECPHCNRTGNRPNMMRWHFDNCAIKTRHCIQCSKPIPKKYKACQYNTMKYCDHKCYGESKLGISWGNGITNK